MRSVRCERCGFVQAERATCRKCGFGLDVVRGERGPAIGPGESREQAEIVSEASADPGLVFEEAEEARLAVGAGGGAVRGRSSPLAASQPSTPASNVAPSFAESAPAKVGPQVAVSAAEPSSEAPPPVAHEPRAEPAPRKPAREPIARIRSVALTATLDSAGHVMVEFQCRKCDRYGVLLVPPELMETGIEGECRACRRSAPMTRVELEAKRFDRYDG